MTSEHVSDDLTGFISGNLDGETSERIRAHLAGCASCRSEFLAINTLWESLGRLPDEAPDESVRARFYDMLKTHQQTDHRATARREAAGDGWLTRLFPRRPVFQFALTLAAVAAGVAALAVLVLGALPAAGVEAAARARVAAAGALHHAAALLAGWTEVEPLADRRPDRWFVG